MQNKLPREFAGLDPWLDWALPTMPQRYAKRVQTPLAEVKAFCAALQPHMDELIRYLSKFKWGTTLDEADENLYRLGLAYMEATIPVDLGWKQSENEGAFPMERLHLPYRL